MPPTVTIVCTKCGKKIRGTRRQAARAGWTQRTGRELCKEHSEEDWRPSWKPRKRRLRWR